MLQIDRFTVEGLAQGCVTDEAAPRFSFSLASDATDVTLDRATISVGEWSLTTTDQINVPYAGPKLLPFSTYEATVVATASTGETAEATLTFETGRMGGAWAGQWISDAAYSFTEKGVSPVPMIFRKQVKLASAAGKKVASARIYATALGIYELQLNGAKVGDEYFAPGFTSYKTHLMYQTYDVTELLSGDDTLTVTVAGGWAVGSFVFTRTNRYDGDRQALLLELRVRYDDGSEEVVGTDTSWQVSEDGPYRMVDLYDGETYDATVDVDAIAWRQATPETLKIHPTIEAAYGAPVRAHEELVPVAAPTKVGDVWVYDFGQNFAGVIKLHVLRAEAGQVVTVRHAELLNADGSLNVQFLRTAKATATLTCAGGEQTYSPTMSYMGFRYASVEGIEPADLELSALALYSDVESIGEFECSDPMLNQLQSNIRWGTKSNFVDIPTDCPQRDERMGWTGDIAVFSPTACYNFDADRFLSKWLRDVKAEQLKSGGIPNSVPVQGYGFPATMPKMAVAWWGDACVLVPWAMYQAYGDADVLRDMYPTMKRYVKAEKFWCGLTPFGKSKYIWNMPGVLGFGDWVAPDVPQMSQWQARVKWTGTASLCNLSAILAKVATILGEDEDAAYYADLSAKVADAYCSKLTDGNGKLLEEFQTAYVLPIYLDMFPDEATKAKATQNLVELVKKSDYCIGTGFPGTPYILFALADNGQAETAYKMLMNTKCPSWLYEVRVGATTIWERWDGLDENGQCPIGDDGTDQMISYNHYSSGAVGNFLYQRVAGLEPTTPGYRTFRVRPVLGGGLTSARGSVRTPYGVASSSWTLDGDAFELTVEVPVGTTCEVVLPSGATQTLGSGTHTLRE